MAERCLTFIDVDENRLELWLKPDRVQLVVVDSRPELEAGELRRFASVVFAEYVGRDLVARLAAARDALHEARNRSDELAEVIDGALGAIDGVASAVAVAALARSGSALALDDDASDDLEIAATADGSGDGDAVPRVGSGSVPEGSPDPRPDPRPDAPVEPAYRPGSRPYRTIASRRRATRGSRVRDGSTLVWATSSSGRPR